MQHLQNTHDLRLPNWGPYTKKYIGVSHLADPKRGWRFDLSLFPGFYRRKVDIPSVLWESGYHPWEASADLNYFCHRHELQWKDEVFCDIAFAKPPAARDDSARLWRCECVNATAEPQNIVLHLMASLQKPPIVPATPEFPPNAVWLDALDYEEMTFAQFRALDYLVPDLLLRGEVRGGGFVGGSGLGKGFGAAAGDQAVYQFHLEKSLDAATLLLRFRAPQGKTTRLQLRGGVENEVTLRGAGDFAVHALEIGRLESGSHRLEIASLGGDEIELDGFVVCESGAVREVRFELRGESSHPTLSAGSVPNSLILQYPGLKACYGLRWGFDSFQIREFHCDDLDILMRHQVHKHTTKVFQGEGEGHFSDVYLHPIPLDPHSQTSIYGLTCVGSRAEVEAQLAAFDASPAVCEAQFESARASIAAPSFGAEGEKYEFSQARMRATLLCNVVYPAYARRSHIRHSTPGRWWDSLYTWDSGFIGLGLLELDAQRAVDCLNAYMTEPGDPHAAYAHHGSPVPVQHYLFLELWNRTQSREQLEHFYPRLKGFYEFLAGRDVRSRTRKFASNLLQTWDYFYNSGGWDDYPPQVHVHDQKLEESVTPVTTTAHVLRAAKILRLAALQLGEIGDAEEYAADIDQFRAALAPAWDEDAGYFSYVRHDENGQFEGILRHQSGANFNMGLDGASPLIAGVCSTEQQKRLVAHLFSERELWTPIGLSTVDQSAPYYRKDGYWNGAVWMPHQWFYWKTLLDLGEGARAEQIARTGLETWRAEVDASYGCFEHFIVQSGRGAGWHQFGGLSAPVLGWFASYFTPGTLTGGLDVWVGAREWSADFSSLRAGITQAGEAPRDFDFVAVMNPAFEYRARWDGENVETAWLASGALQIHCDGRSPSGELLVERV